MARWTSRHQLVQDILGSDGFYEDGDIKPGAYAKAKSIKASKLKHSKSRLSRIKKRLRRR